MRRRDFLKAGGVAGAALALPVQQWIASASGGSQAMPAPFSVPLHVPGVLRPSRRTLAADYYQITVKEAAVPVIPGTTTTMLTYNGTFPGPTISTIRGRKVVVRYTNALTDPIVTHLHGGHASEHDDGYPMDNVAPGAYRDYTYTNQQLATTLWYHDHAHHQSAEHVYRGMAGFHLINDPAELKYRLPSGPYEVPLMLRTVHMDENAQLVYQMNDYEGRRTNLVNGSVQPYFQVAARKYRFRVLNSADDTAYKLKLADGSQIVQIGSDGGLLPAPVYSDNVDLFPAERADIVIDFSRYPVGTSVELVNDYTTDEVTHPVMRFDIVRTAPDDSRIPTAGELPDLPAPPAPVVTRDLALRLNPENGEYLINDQVFDQNRVDFHVKKGQPEVWRITNLDTAFGMPHSMHTHVSQFQVLDRSGVPAGPSEQGWKDTVKVWPGETVRIAVTYKDYTGRFVYHCHIMDHSSGGMMGQMEIT